MLSLSRDEVIKAYDILPQECRDKLADKAEGMVCALYPDKIVKINSHYRVSLDNTDSSREVKEGENAQS